MHINTSAFSICMKERSHSNVNLVATALFKRNNEPLSFLQYMKERSYTNVKLVDIALLRKGIKKVQSIKEKSH